MIAALALLAAMQAAPGASADSVPAGPNGAMSAFALCLGWAEIAESATSYVDEIDGRRQIITDQSLMAGEIPPTIEAVGGNTCNVKYQGPDSKVLWSSIPTLLDRINHEGCVSSRLSLSHIVLHCAASKPYPAFDADAQQDGEQVAMSVAWRGPKTGGPDDVPPLPQADIDRMNKALDDEVAKADVEKRTVASIAQAELAKLQLPITDHLSALKLCSFLMRFANAADYSTAKEALSKSGLIESKNPPDLTDDIAHWGPINFNKEVERTLKGRIYFGSENHGLAVLTTGDEQAEASVDAWLQRAESGWVKLTDVPEARITEYFTRIAGNRAFD